MGQLSLARLWGLDGAAGAGDAAASQEIHHLTEN